MVTINGSTPRSQIRDFQRQMEALGVSHVRGVLFSLNGVAMAARERITSELPVKFDQPNAYTMRAIGARFVPLNTASLRNISSEVFVKTPSKGGGEASAYLKYHMGSGSNKRLPGDVGAADQHIFVPLWANLQRVGVRPVRGDTLPRNTLQKFARQAGVTLGSSPPPPGSSRRRSRSHSGVFFGAPRFGGVQHGLGFWARPRRTRVGGQMLNEGAPFMLVRAADHATYNPTLQRTWDQICIMEMRTFPLRLEHELRLKLAHLGRAAPPSSIRDFLGGV